MMCRIGRPRCALAVSMVRVRTEMGLHTPQQQSGYAGVQTGRQRGQIILVKCALISLVNSSARMRGGDGLLHFKGPLYA